MASERRQTVRFRVSSKIDVTSADVQLPLDLVDLGLGGFSVRSATKLPVGVVMRLRFATPDGGWDASLTAKSVYSFEDPKSPNGTPTFLSGFRFLNPETPVVMARINALIDRATAVISFS